MPHGINPQIIKASLDAYLNGLQESGVSGIPANMAAWAASGAVPPVPALPALPDVRPMDDLSAISRHESLDNIRKAVGECRICSIGKKRKHAVFGAGDPNARLLFVGEAPGVDDENKAEPFAGESGQVLNRIITAMGLKREDVYICNVVKCRTPDNRDPETDEIAACSPFLLRQIQSVKPEVVVAMGKAACQALLGVRDPVVRLRGQFRNYHGIPLMPTHAPSYLLSNKTDSGLFWDVWDDMTQVLRLLKLPVPDKSRKK